ncbi:hypothetical protein CEUSTIGMA_g6187.t1 [Chlamydomonas eustigma]|uniref:cysteine--tRNA ligase n=1 Tax=Chlamydomonas eustigma TaxID=1157962 RepID=A0A250X7L3_9CHLO|nr:hypothetical protein CEUSTIGMA_g6187.t1 [Chlamydomonas eustigma]|eukprot:GAX78750.1 hypothetical protein CEUSTIGMA_g6187.t1 [Chlamydomonas eustigma]
MINARFSNRWTEQISFHRRTLYHVKIRCSVIDREVKDVESPSSHGSSLTAGDKADLRAKLYLYNTMSRGKEHFRPREQKPESVQMYVCGVTVYDYSHIGHARVYVAFDILYRLLQLLNYNVQYVRNFTDIDDKIIARANEKGEDPLALSRRFIDEFHKDMESLGCLPPSFEPKATDFIPQMITTIQRIIDNGHAYAVEGGDVYFEVYSLPGYGRLSGRAQEDNRAGERVDVDSRKRGPADFALWKSAKAGEPNWPSPWGPGRPGWHIECSSMIEAVMGSGIDIHGGGRDLVFPHHENELAQSRAAAGPCSCGAVHPDDQSSNGLADVSTSVVAAAKRTETGLIAENSSSSSSSTSQDDRGQGDDATGKGFVRYWLHNGFVNVDSEKMSKSLGNFFTIREVIAKYHPIALRWFLVSTHYRQQVNYTQRALEEASDRLYYVYQSLLDITKALNDAGAEGVKARSQEEAAVVSSSSPSTYMAAILALLDDMNTPSAISELSGPLKAANDLLTTKAGRKAPNRVSQLASIERQLGQVLRLLGLVPAVAGSTLAPESNSSLTSNVSLEVVNQVLTELRRLVLVRANLSEADVLARIGIRAEARQAKDFQAADRVRVELAGMGVMIMDTPEGTTWRPGLPSVMENSAV